jgi:hypothetical protein
MEKYTGKCPSCHLALLDTSNYLRTDSQVDFLQTNKPRKFSSSARILEPRISKSHLQEITALSSRKDSFDETLSYVQGGQATSRIVTAYGSDFTRFFMHKMCVELLDLDRTGSFIVIDGGNVFDLYLLTHLAQVKGINQDSLLEAIFVARAFTCYQLTSLVIERLEEALTQRTTKQVMVLNITDLFVDPDVPPIEARLLFKEICRTLKQLSKRHGLTVFVGNPLRTAETYLSAQLSLQELLAASSDEVIRISEAKCHVKFVREKGVHLDRRATFVRKKDLGLNRLAASRNPMAILPNNTPSTRVWSSLT